MRAKVKSILLVIVAVAVTVIFCNIYNRNRLRNLICESAAYNMYLSSCQ